jgi:hypothetical protein
MPAAEVAFGLEVADRGLDGATSQFGSPKTPRF